jgi:hypothetical protein
MSKTRHKSKSYYDPSDYDWDNGDTIKERDEMKERRRQKKIRAALKTKNLDVLMGSEE